MFKKYTGYVLQKLTLVVLYTLLALFGSLAAPFGTLCLVLITAIDVLKGHKPKWTISWDRPNLDRTDEIQRLTGSGDHAK